MEPTSTIVSMQKVHLISSLLHTSLTNFESQAQKYVYSELSKIQHEGSTYTALAYIFRNEQKTEVRKIAGITLKVTLKRNIREVEFKKEEIEYIRSMMLDLSWKDQGLEGIENSLIGLLATFNQNLDFKILQKLIEEVKGSNPQRQVRSLSILTVIFQDLRLQSENYSIFQSSQFLTFTKVFVQCFALRLQEWNIPVCQHCLKCMNLLIPQIGQQSQIISIYCFSYLLPILKAQEIPSSMAVEVIEGLTQIMETNSKIIIHNTQTLQKISLYANEDREIKKKWMNLMVDIIDSDISDANLKALLPTIIPKIILGLVFTSDDEKNMKMELEEEVNPYQYDGEEENELNKVYSGNYTLRKLSIMSLERLTVRYPDEVWQICKPIIGQGINSQNLIQKQCCTMVSAIISENVDDYFQDLQLILPSLISNVEIVENPQILRCTSLWAIQKMSGIIVGRPEIKKSTISVLFNCIGKENSPYLKQSAFNALNGLISRSEEFLQVQLSQIANCLLFGIKSSQKKLIYTVLRTIADLYGKFSVQIQDNLTGQILKGICEKWQYYSTVQSIACCVVECLVTVTSSLPPSLNQYALDIFNYCLPSLKNVNQKQILIRVIDLLTSLISLNIQGINSFIASNQTFHQAINHLMMNEDREIKHSGYYFLGDVSKAVRFPTFAQFHAQGISSTFDMKNLTTCSNGLTCMTDLLICHPQLAERYSNSVMEIACQKMNISHLQKFYHFNFARVYGRLGCVNPQGGGNLLQKNLKPTCLGLRANEYQKLTDQAFKGLFMMVMACPKNAIHHFQFLVDSFICYPCKDEETSAFFITILKEFKRSLSKENWDQFLGKSIFLPATVKKIGYLCET